MKINEYIDHTLLKADAKSNDIINLCNEAMEYKFAAVCVNPTFITLAKDLLKNSKVKVCTPIGFPLGANTNITKVMEARDAIDKGADELDMVINIGALKDGKIQYITNEIAAVKTVAKTKIVKVIIETCLLSNEEIITACKCIENAGADYIKTSTGFSASGAQIEQIKLIKSIIDKNKKIKIKASGDIKDGKKAKSFIALGVDRIGTSHGVDIFKALKNKNIVAGEK